MQIVHFYRESTFRCKIVDKHLSELAPRHIEYRMVKINAEKAPFLTKKLHVRILPTLLLVEGAQVRKRVVGFDSFGGKDDFPTEVRSPRCLLLAACSCFSYSSLGSAL